MTKIHSPISTAMRLLNSIQLMTNYQRLSWKSSSTIFHEFWLNLMLDQIKKIAFYSKWISLTTTFKYRHVNKLIISHRWWKFIWNVSQRLLQEQRSTREILDYHALIIRVRTRSTSLSISELSKPFFKCTVGSRSAPPPKKYLVKQYILRRPQIFVWCTNSTAR